MNPQEYINHLQSRFKTYTHFKLLLTSDITKEEFNAIVKDTVDNIRDDNKMNSEFNSTLEHPIPVIQKQYGELMKYTKDLLEYLYYFKNLVFS